PQLKIILLSVISIRQHLSQRLDRLTGFVFLTLIARVSLPNFWIPTVEASQLKHKTTPSRLITLKIQPFLKQFLKVIKLRYQSKILWFPSPNILAANIT